MRSNVADVLCQLSQQGMKEDYKDVVIGLKSVRDTMKPEQVGRMRRTASDIEVGSSRDPQLEGSSNLFYYLFEDYGGAATILAKSKEIIYGLVRQTHLSPFDVR